MLTAIPSFHDYSKFTHVVAIVFPGLFRTTAKFSHFLYLFPTQDSEAMGHPSDHSGVCAIKCSNSERDPAAASQTTSSCTDKTGM